MKQDFYFSKKHANNTIKWLISFSISIIIMIVLIMVLALVQKRFRFEEHIIRLMLIIFFAVSAGICAYVFRRLSSVKGYISGLVTAVTFVLVKLVLSIVSGGVGKMNFMVFIIIIPAALIGGILSANQKKKPKW